MDPNRKVSRDIHVISPLREVGMTKEEASGLLKELGYREFIRYENTCMATRIAIGEPITIKKIRNIRAAENYLAGMGFSCVRVRSKGSKARIEVEKSQVDDLIQMQEEVREELLNLGFDDVEIDPEGYRESGYRCGI